MPVKALAPMPARPAILSRALLLRFVSIIGSSISFYLPLAVLPRYADATGARANAGLATGALLVATVVGEMATPWIVSRIGYRWSLAVGLVLLGAPTLVLLGHVAIPVVLGVSALRGIGFAITVVAGGALTAVLIPAERRGEGVAVVGLVSGVSSVLALPAGVWVAGLWGTGVVFVITAAAPIAAVATLPGLPGRRPVDGGGGRGNAVIGGTRALLRPAIIFAACTVAVGVLVTYLPLALDGHVASWIAPAALFVQPATATAARWVAGRLGDRRGQTGLLVPGLMLAVTGMAMLAATHSATTVVCGAAVFGAGFGVLQNATLTLMYSRVPAAGYSAASAIWNAAYDLGMAAGAIGAGLLATVTGFSAAFLLTAAAMLPALLLAWREQTGSLARRGTGPVRGSRPCLASQS